MSRRKQSNPKPIIKPNEGDENGIATSGNRMRGTNDFMPVGTEDNHGSWVTLSRGEGDASVDSASKSYVTPNDSHSFLSKDLGRNASSKRDMVSKSDAVRLLAKEDEKENRILGSTSSKTPPASPQNSGCRLNSPPSAQQKQNQEFPVRVKTEPNDSYPEEHTPFDDRSSWERHEASQTTHDRLANHGNVQGSPGILEDEQLPPISSQHHGMRYNSEEASTLSRQVSRRVSPSSPSGLYHRHRRRSGSSPESGKRSRSPQRSRSPREASPAPPDSLRGSRLGNHEHLRSDGHLDPREDGVAITSPFDRLQRTSESSGEPEAKGPRLSSHARFPIIPNGKSTSLSNNKLEGNSNSHRGNKSSDSDARSDIKPHNLAGINFLHGNTTHLRPSDDDMRTISSATDSDRVRVSESFAADSLPDDASARSPPEATLSSPNAQQKSQRASRRSQEEAEVALVNQLQLPSDVLYLRQQEVNIHGTPNMGWVICSAIPLPQGSSLGPFQGQLVAPEEVKVGDLIVQFTSRRGQQALLNVAGQSGGWLALLRTPRTTGQRNTHVYWEGGRIWCEVISDIAIGTELRASFSFQHEEEEEEEEEVEGDSIDGGVASTPPPPPRSGSATIGAGRELQGRPQTAGTPVAGSGSGADGATDGAPGTSQQPTVSVTSGARDFDDSPKGMSDEKNLWRQQHLDNLPPQHPHQQQPAPGHAALIYGCPFCGVRFSSPRTLQGHLSFYCSKKTTENVGLSPATGGGLKERGNNRENHLSTDIQLREDCVLPDRERFGIKRRASNNSSTNSRNCANLSPSSTSTSPPRAKSARTQAPASLHSPRDDTSNCSSAGDLDYVLLACDLCAFRTDKPANMARHKRLHDAEAGLRRAAEPDKTSDQLVRRQGGKTEATERRLTTPGAEMKSPSSDTFCKECKIQFSSYHTYKCHKEHYCAQRRKKATTEPSPFAAMFHSPFAGFPPEGVGAEVAGLPSALQMAALSQGGLILPGESAQSAMAAAMIFQANMAAMSFPMLLHQQREAALNASAAASSMGNSGVQRSVISRTSPPSPSQSIRAGSPVSRENRERRPPIIRSPQQTYPPANISPMKRISKEYDNSSHHSHESDQTRETNLEGLNQSASISNVIKSEPVDPEGAHPFPKEKKADDDHPLDLTVTKMEPQNSPGHDVLSPARRSSDNGEHEMRKDIPRSSRSSSASEPDIRREHNISAHRSKHALDDDRRLGEREATSIGTTSMGSGFLSPTASVAPHLLPPPPGHTASLLIPPPGFLPHFPALPALNISPPSKSKSHESNSSASAPPKTISKCVDCNIVFYKHDNYLIHKKHYCSGKRRQTPNALRQSLSPKPQASPSHSVRNQPSTSPPLPRLSPSVSRSPKKSNSSSPPTPMAASPDNTQAPTFSRRSRESRHSPPGQVEHRGNEPNESAGHAGSRGVVRYKFFCVPCRIKFSTASILEAHKEYYCPAGKDSEHSVILHMPSSSNTSDDTESTVVIPSSSATSGDTLNPTIGSPTGPTAHEEVTCTHCNSVFTSARLLRLHVCDGGFPCPHCDHVAITENRLSEHLKAHAPTRAFRCTICGYRGNTARGMRMHGKTHIDEGLDFTDENMLEYQEPALMPILPHGSSVGLINGGPGSSDSELLRMKNEPYKRRRSRKAYEKFDYPLPKVDIPQTCPLCGQNFANADFLASHFKVHQIAASQYLAGLMKCIHCEYVGKSPDDLRAHFEANHARNHRIHVPQRVSGTNTHATITDPSLAFSQDTNSNEATENIEHEEVEEAERPTHMVLEDPNSPLDQKHFIQEENNSEDDDGDDKSSTRINKDTAMVKSHSSGSPYLVQIKDEPMDPEEDVEQQTTIQHFLHLPADTNSSDNNRDSPLQPSPSYNPPAGDLLNVITQSEQLKEHGETGNCQSSPGAVPFKTDNLVKQEDRHPDDHKHDSSGADTHSCSSATRDIFTTAAKSSSPKANPSPNSPHNISGATPGRASQDKHDLIQSPSSRRLSEGSSQYDIKSEAPYIAATPSPGEAPRVKQEPIEPEDEAISFAAGSPPITHESSPGTSSASVGGPPTDSRGLLISKQLSPSSPVLSTTFSSHPATSTKMSISEAAAVAAGIAPPIIPRTTASKSSASTFPGQHPMLSNHLMSVPFPYNAPHPGLPLFFLQAPPHHPGPSLLSSPTAHAKEDRASRYCQNCDIAFSKHATYLAHKKYYCTARPRGEAQPSATA